MAGVGERGAGDKVGEAGIGAGLAGTGEVAATVGDSCGDSTGLGVAEGDRGVGEAGVGERGAGEAGVGERGAGETGVGERGEGESMGDGVRGRRMLGDSVAGEPGRSGDATGACVATSAGLAATMGACRSSTSRGAVPRSGGGTRSGSFVLLTWGTGRTPPPPPRAGCWPSSPRGKMKVWPLGSSSTPVGVAGNALISAGRGGATIRRRRA